MSTAKNASPEQIEREISDTRLALSNTLDAIQARFSPMRLLSDSFGAARGAAAGAARGARSAGGELRDAGGDFATNLTRTIRDNPVPVALFGIGLGWLMLAGRRRNGEDDYRAVGYEAGPARWDEDPHPPPFGYAAPRETNPDIDDGEMVDSEQPGAVDRIADDARDKAGSAYTVVEGRAEQVKDTMAEIGAEVRARASETGEAAAQAASRARERFGSAAASARDYAGRAGSTTRDYAGRAGYAARDYADRAGSAVRDYAVRGRDRAAEAGRTAVRVAEEHPLLVAAGLFAAGATVAALLPRTRREDAWMGESADAMRRSAQETASGLADEAKSVVGSVAAAARDAAEREGLTPADLQRETVRAAEKVGDVAEATGDAARSEADRALSRGNGGGPENGRDAAGQPIRH